jgi:predicted aldo/keto reductase-like oxidoreductase
MRFPRKGQKVDIEKTEQLMLAAIENGVNYFDTAYFYGSSEEIVGTILERNDKRDKIFLATKLPIGMCKTPEDLDTLFNTQLERLRTDYFDYYLMHNLSSMENWEKLCALGIKEWIAQKRESGQIREIGFSFHGSQSEFLALLDAYDWDIVQIQYNYMNVNYQAGQLGLRKAHEKGLSVVIMEPLLGGKLATGLPKKAASYFKAADPQRSYASWGLKWIWDQPEPTVVLSGMSSLEQLTDNLATAADVVPGALTTEEHAVFIPVEEAFKETDKVACTGCNYCMPCPQGVNIPACFASYNLSYAVGLFSGVQLYVTSTGGTNPGRRYGAAECIKCGACEKKCPQHLPIMESLGAVKKRLEPRWLKLGMKIFMKLL